MRCDTVLSFDYGLGRDSLVDIMFNDWHNAEFKKICKQFYIPEVSCSGCTSVVADIKIEIDSAGKVKAVKILKGKACSQPFAPDFITALENSLSKLVFPVRCYGKCYSKRIGRALKC
jgi:hypothetical protein